jgi:putative insertion element HTH domain-containing protein
MSNEDRANSGGDEATVPENARGCPISQNRLSGAYSSLNDKQKTAVEMLAVGKSLGRVARFIEIDSKTLYRWRHDPIFRDALHHRRRELWSDAIDRVRGMASTSLDIIEQHLSDRYERIRFRAAQTVLNLASIKKHAAEAGDPQDDDERAE